MGKIIEPFTFRADRGEATATALIDSGAVFSLIRRDVANRITGHILELKACELRTVSGDTWLRAHEGVFLEICMKTKWLNGPFYVIDQMPREVIIGVDFLQRWEISLHPKRHDFTIGLDPEKGVEIDGLACPA